MQPSSDERQKPKALDWLNCIWFVPLLAVAALLSTPVMAVWTAYCRRKETSFARQMKLAGRTMSEREYAAALESKRGTLIWESFSHKGPSRYWWTEDDIPSITPLRWADSGFAAAMYREYDEFSSWCQTNYLENNKARFLSGSYASNGIRVRENTETAIAIPVVAILSAAALRKIR